MSQQNQSDSNEFPKILELEFSIGGWNSKQRLTLEGNEVNVFPPARFGWPEAVITHSPSNEQWLEFSKSLKRLDVANWKKSYMDPHILDGTQWNLLVITETSEIYTGGSNAYPENFNGLILAISRLIEEDYQYELNETSMILELEFEIGGFPAGPHRLILKENKISVTPPPWSYEDAAFSHIPSDEEWMEFIQSLKKLKVWDWKEDYLNPTFLSGTQWELRIRTDSFKLHIGGSNKFPTNFDEFIKSIDKLINKDYFADDYESWFD